MISQSCRRDWGFQPGRWFVQEEQVGVADQRTGHGQALPLAARQLAHPGTGLLLQRNSPDRFLGLETVSVETAEEPQGLKNRQLLRELGFLQRDADALLDVVVAAGAPAKTQHLDFTGSWSEQTFQDFNGCGLARPVGTEQAKALAHLDRQVQAAHGFHGGFAVVALPQVQTMDGKHPLIIESLNVNVG